jgi:hypothetical protein
MGNVYTQIAIFVYTQIAVLCIHRLQFCVYTDCILVYKVGSGLEGGWVLRSSQAGESGSCVSWSSNAGCGSTKIEGWVGWHWMLASSGVFRRGVGNVYTQIASFVYTQIAVLCIHRSGLWRVLGGSVGWLRLWWAHRSGCLDGSSRAYHTPWPCGRSWSTTIVRCGHTGTDSPGRELVWSGLVGSLGGMVGWVRLVVGS